MGIIQHPCRAVILLLVTVALTISGPASAFTQTSWQGPIVRHEGAEERLTEVMNQLRTEVYGLPAMTFRPFEGRDIDYLMCLVNSNRSTGRLEHYPPACGRAVENGGAEVLAWNWTSLGGTTNDLVAAWNVSDGHRHLMLGTGDQVSTGVFCIGTTAYGVAWFRRSDNTHARANRLARIDPPDPYRDWFGTARYPMFTDNTFVCDDSGDVSRASRPHSDFASTPDPTTQPRTIEELVRQRSGFATGHADVLRLYRAYFSRTPDLAGAAYWLDIFDRGYSAHAIAGFMSDSTEFRLAFDGASDEAFLRQVYRNALGREPDPRGFAYWLDLLSSGQIDQVETVFFVAFGTEFRTNYSFGGK